MWPVSNWFADIRSTQRGTGGATIAQWIKENPRFATGTIAIAGLDASILAHIRSAEGEVNWQSVDMLKHDFPKARFVSATKVLGEARWRKSDEEIEFLRKGTEVAEATLAAMQKHARAGVRERHVFAQMMFANADAGGSFTPMFGWATGPKGTTWHRLEQPSFRTFAAGDVARSRDRGALGRLYRADRPDRLIGQASAELDDAISSLRGVRPRHGER